MNKQKPESPISYQQLIEMLHEGTLYEHHSAYFSCYVSRDAIGEFRVGTGHTLPQARKIAIEHYEKERTI